MANKHMTITNDHQPVLLTEAIQGLSLKADGYYIDATFGRGGHSQEILKHLNQHGHLLAMDRDADAIKQARIIAAQEPKLSVQHNAFSQLKRHMGELNLAGKVDGILADLGVSSPQLDQAIRGFSFNKNGPLDMRMDKQQTINAKDWLNKAKEKDIADILKNYGEERYAKRIARAITEFRKTEAITETLQLASIIAKAHPAWEKHKHPATRSFQAIRIHINQELAELQTLLNDALDILKPKGRLVIISFHSLEDKIVKRFFQKEAKGDDLPSSIPITVDQIKPKLKIIGKPIKASSDENKENIRARSAILRIAEKI